MRRFVKLVLKIFPFVLMAAIIITVLITGKEFTVDDILSRVPDNTPLAVAAILLMYAAKSISVVFPILIIQVAAGIIFPAWLALAVNIFGTTVAYSIPYAIGRISGTDGAEKMMRKYPRLREIVDMQRNSEWFVSFILRAVSCLPADIVSMYLGTIKFKYVPYIIAGVVGTFPGLIPATFIGVNVMNPKSSAFIVSVAVTVISSAASVIIYYFVRNRAKN